MNKILNEIMKGIMKKIFYIIIIILIFICYLYFDRNIYNESFDLIGHPNKEEDSPFGYTSFALKLKNLKNEDISSALIIDDDLNRDDRINEISGMINDPSNERLYDLNEIEKDIKYFNNSSHLEDGLRVNNQPIWGDGAVE